MLFLKLRACYTKLKKGLKARQEEIWNERGSSPVKMDESSNDNGNMFSVIIPDFTPITSWIKNMSTLLMSELWLNDNNLRREAVCTLLGLDASLLNRKYHGVLRDWVSNNRSVVRILEIYGLQDRLSKALVDCLRSMSTENWRCKILLSFGPTGAAGLTSFRFSLPLTETPYEGHLPYESKVPGKRIGKLAEKRNLKVTKRDRSGLVPKSSASSTLSAPKKKARYSSAHSHDSLPGKAVNDSEVCREEEDEIGVPCEDLQCTESYDNNESPDDYDYSDDL